MTEGKRSQGTAFAAVGSRKDSEPAHGSFSFCGRVIAHHGQPYNDRHEKSSPILNFTITSNHIHLIVSGSISTFRSDEDELRCATPDAVLDMNMIPWNWDQSIAGHENATYCGDDFP
ncbi:MAG: hypothetical protein JEZ11_08635 [Desulfobacterales bacterium]|nr:hypothetical protein [Desulfobacterales bacterium]